MMMKTQTVSIRKNFSYDYKSTFSPFLTHVNGIGEALPLASLTVPDMSMPLPVFIDRFRRHLAVPTIPTANVPLDVSAFDKLDVFQRIDFARNLKRRIQVLNTTLINEKAKASKAQADIDNAKLIDDQVAKRLAELSSKVDKS